MPTLPAVRALVEAVHAFRAATTETRRLLARPRAGAPRPQRRPPNPT